MLLRTAMFVQAMLLNSPMIPSIVSGRIAQQVTREEINNAEGLASSHTHTRLLPQLPVPLLPPAIICLLARLLDNNTQVHHKVANSPSHHHRPLPLPINRISRRQTTILKLLLNIALHRRQFKADIPTRDSILNQLILQIHHVSIHSKPNHSGERRLHTLLQILNMVPHTPPLILLSIDLPTKALVALTTVPLYENLSHR